MIGRKLSHFRVLDRVGEGGMGVVYKAEDENLQRVVALKILPPDRLADQERRLRFLREARAAAAITHPNIAVVHEIDESDGAVFIAMELIEGRTLRAAIGGKPMPLREVLRLGVEIAEGLSAAHHARLVHRDLKPDNVMVTLEGRVKILDFGLAKLLQEREEPAPGAESRLATISDEMTQAGRVLGTAAYMSPEQVRGQSVDTRSDLFAFGIVLHEMTTGAPPFRGATSMDVMTAILHKEPAVASQINAEATPELERIIGKCLEKDPGDRYQDTRDLVVDLRRLKRGTESGATGKPAATEQGDLIEGTKRRRVVAGIVWAGIAVALAAAGIGVWLYQPSTPGSGPLTQRLILSGEEVEGRAVGASLSPDGRHLAFSTRDGLFIRELASGATRTLPLPEGGRIPFARWSPDGMQLYAAVANETRSSIWAVSVLTGTFRRLGQDVSAGPWPSPDGKLLAFVPPRERLPNGNELWVMGSQGETPRPIISLREDSAIFRAAWAPDSRWIAFLALKSRAQPEREYVIEVSDPEGKQATVLLSDPRLRANVGQVSHLCWLPDGRILYSLSELPPNGNDMNLWSMPMALATARAAGEPSRITNGTGAALLALVATTDGKRLLAYKLTSRGDVFVGSLSPDGASMGDVRRLTFRNTTDRAEGWTGDGRVVVWSERNGTPDLFSQALDSREATGLVVGPEMVSDASLSPDGSAVLYGVRGPEAPPTDDWILMRLDLADSKTRILGEMRSSASIECPSRAGKPCVLGELGSNEIVFSLFDPELGRGAEFARLPVQSGPPRWKVSPDGERIVLGVWYPSLKPAFRIMDVPGGQVHEVALKGVEGYSGVTFTADGNGLIIRGLLAGGSTPLMRADLDGHTAVLYSDGKEGEWIEDAVPSPKGRHLAFNVRSLSLDLWLLENF